ncbi:hypothetical protein BH09ACT12_BH09ACT12_12640 [soil metagenome]
MPTAVSSTDVTHERPGRHHPVRNAIRATADVGHLLRFRIGTVRHRGLSALGAALMVAVTAAIAIVPAYHPDAGGADAALDVLVVLPTALAGFVLLAAIASAASGGGRELIARDPASIHPISPTTDHLGALLLAPLNIAWLIQAWALMGATSFAVGSDRVFPAEVIVVLWLAAGTAFAQVLAWILEGVRRVPHGIGGVRLLNVVVLGTALGLQLTDRMITVFDQIPTRWFVIAMVDPAWSHWWAAVAVTLAAFVGFVVLGAVPAHIAAHRVPRDELRVESGQYAARSRPRSDLAAMVRTDRSSVWRAVPMRRGVVVLALGPGIVAVLGDLQWSSMTVLPGLVASGGALLYGVNAWCLDSRGALWRESLPVDPRTVFDARAFVLAEFLLAASLLTVAVAAIRAGMPSLPEVSALVATLVVVTVQVVGASMRWSYKRPYAVDLRSSRATPAPPSMMVAYSARLALSTTVTGLFFSALSQSDDWSFSVLFAVMMLAWSGLRLLRVRRLWTDPFQRARVITAVAMA